MSLLLENNNKRTISGIQTTVLRTLCFKTWASHAESTVRCAYCRTTYPYEDACFLCLQAYTEKLNYTTCCAMRKLSQNAPQPSQLYSHSYPTITHWNNADSSFIVINSGYMYKKQFIRTVLIETFIVNVLLL